MFASRALMAGLLVALTMPSAWAADAPITRIPLQSAEAPDTAHSVQSYLVTVAPHAIVARHTHPGVEIGYCLSGSLVVSLAGQPDRTVQPGDSWAFAAGAPHSLANNGDAPARLVVTYVVDATKPLSSAAP